MAAAAAAASTAQLSRNGAGFVGGASIVGSGDSSPATVQADVDHCRPAPSSSHAHRSMLPNASDHDDSSDSDIEWEADFKRLQKPKTSDLRGKDLYMALCNKYGTTPLKSLERAIDGETVVANHSGLGVAGARAMSAPLCASKRLRVLKLEDTMLGPKGAMMVARILHGNAYITEIDLSFNKIGSAGAAHVLSAVQHSVAITKVNLAGNEFEDSDGEHIADVIENNVNIKELILAQNRLSVNSGRLMAEALANNDTIEVLDLSWNQLRLRGAQDLASALSVNRGLKVLNLAMNGFSTEGARALGSALCNNKYLEDLDISFNRISGCAAIEFSKCLRVNCELRILKIHGNPITRDGVAEIMNALSSNAGSNLHYLDMRDLSVHQDFPKTVREIQKKRIFDARVDALLTSAKARWRTLGLASRAVLDFIRSLCQENVRTRVSSIEDAAPFGRPELATELKKAKIPLTSQQRDKVLEAVVENGEGSIDFRKTLEVLEKMLNV